MTQNLRWLLLCLFIGVGSVAWAVTGTITFGSNKTMINGGSVTGSDDLGNSWTITTVGTTYFANNSNSFYSQVGSSKDPATSITFTTTLTAAKNVTAFSAKFGGFKGTDGTVTLKIDDTEVGTGNLNGQNDVTVSSNQVKKGTTLTVTVTGISKGVACYNISYSYDGNGGDAPTPTNTSSFDLTTVSYQSDPTEDLIVWSNDIFTMKNEKNSSSTSVNNYIPSTRTSTRFYSENLLTITPASSYKITKVTFIAASESYANVLANSTWTNATASASGTEVTITPTDGTSAIQATIGATCGFTKVEVEYEETTPKTSTSVTINATGINTDIANGNNLGQLLATVLANDEAISEAPVDWSSSDETVATVDENGNVTASKIGTTTITATYVGNTTYASSFATYDLTVINSTPIPSTNNTFQKITSTNDLVAGCEYVIVNEGSSSAIAKYNNLYFGKTNITISNNTFEANNNINVLTLGGTEGAWTFATSLEAGKYLGLRSDGNYLESLENGGTWLISFDADGNALIQPVNHTERLIMYNSSQPRFACYRGTQNKIQLFKKVESLIRVIPDVATLKAFRESVNRGDNYDGVEVKLTADLNMNDLNTTDNWQASIGTEDHPFRGIFNGQNHTISNLKNRSTQGSGEALPILTPNGLFGYIEGATIQDLSLTGLSIVNYGINTDVTSDETEVFTRGFGGLVGVADNSTIINCDVKGSVTYATSNNVGFVVGLMKGSSSVTGCDVDITTLNGHRATGGIVGGIQVDGNKTATITDCSTKGAGGGNAYTGGIAGYVYTADGSNAIISKCFNKANFSGAYDYMGGVVGYVVSEGVTIESCYNEGHIGGGLAKFIGGIAGYNKGVITNCYNTGAVAGSANIGGIIGLSASNTYSYVYCTGEITGDKVGGIIGAGYGSVDGHCYYLSTLDYGCPSGVGVTPDGRSLGDQISDEAMNFTQLSLSNMQGWKLSSDASDKLGEGKDLGTVFGETRKWIFVRANLPILTGVRGQTVQIVGAPGQHNASESSTYTYAYASFYSDMTFKCTTSFTGIYESASSKSAFKVKFVQVPQGIMYGGVDSNGKKKGYILFQNYIVDDSEIDPKPKFTLEYLPNEVATSAAAMSLKDGNIFYGTHSYTLKDDMKVSDGNLYSLSVIDKVAAYRPYIGKYLGGNKSYIIYNYEEVAQSLGTEPTANPTANQVRPAAIRLSNLFVEPSKVLLGDVDVDGSVTISDVVKVVNAIISDVYDDDVMEYGDVNGDGELDVADVVGIVNTVLDIRYDDVKARKVSSAVNGGNEASLEQNDGLVDFLLNNSNAFCAFQFYMNAEDGLDCEKVTLSARAKGHSVSMNKLSDGRYKVMCYSGGNNTFSGNEGELFNILISGASGKLTLENLFFVTPGASKVKFGNLDIDVVPTGINSIDADVNANAAIFDLSGRRVQQPQKGVYIVNGKKIMY